MSAQVALSTRLGQLTCKQRKTRENESIMAEQKRDYNEVLGVAKDSSEEDIKKA